MFYLATFCRHVLAFVFFMVLNFLVLCQLLHSCKKCCVMMCDYAVVDVVQLEIYWTQWPKLSNNPMSFLYASQENTQTVIVAKKVVSIRRILSIRFSFCTF